LVEPLQILQTKQPPIHIGFKLGNRLVELGQLHVDKIQLAGEALLGSFARQVNMLNVLISSISFIVISLLYELATKIIVYFDLSKFLVFILIFG
jgi:hypothetical protein